MMYSSARCCASVTLVWPVEFIWVFSLDPLDRVVGLDTSLNRIGSEKKPPHGGLRLETMPTCRAIASPFADMGAWLDSQSPPRIVPYSHDGL